MIHQTVPVITIDGPSGSGKGTVALRVSGELRWHLLDSGALYRALALYAVRRKVPLDDEPQLAVLATSLPLKFTDGHAMLDGEDVENEIRSEKAGDRASRVAPFPAVREALLSWQRSCAMPPGLVADGRDMGTVVFPDAGCKIFLTASVEQRAQRRFNQLREKGFDVNIRRLFEEITERDRRDAGRRVSPLRPAGDAVLLDTTELSIDQVVGVVLNLVARSLDSARI